MVIISLIVLSSRIVPCLKSSAFKPIIKLSSIYLTSPPLLPLPPSDSSWVLLTSHGPPFLLDSCQDCMICSVIISHTSLCPHSLVLPHLSCVSSVLDQLIICSLCIWVGRENHHHCVDGSFGNSYIFLT